MSSKPSEQLFETVYWDIRLSYKQVYVCRAVVVLKRKCPNLSQVTLEEWEDLHKVIKKYEACITTSFGADLFNWSCFMNNAFREPTPQPQVHWHVRPRFAHPVEIGGRQYVDPNFANHYDISLDAEETPDSPQEEQHSIAEAIRNALITNTIR